MFSEYTRTFIKDTLKRIAKTAILIGLSIAISMLPFWSKGSGEIIGFFIGFLIGIPIGLLWVDWWATWF
ncbi:MAG: hypothetical protein J7J44_07615 [Deltaproteobacteria bacterium]|nr:hypothetical protein [Deltaproteobacteria bacterium]